MNSKRWSVLWVALAGCAGASDPHSYVQALQAKENHRHGTFGHLAQGVSDRSQLADEAEARPVADAVVDHLAATRDLRLFGLTYVRTEAERICFEKRLAIGTEAERRTEAEQIGKRWSFVARSHRSLDEIAPGTPWPAPSGASSVVAKESETGGGPREAEVCTAAPALDADTRYLTVTAVDPQRPRNNFILVWDFEGKLKDAE